ncbi:butyrophilin-like protein 10 isoform X3 [Notolabrus celidotus]|uniref:butyrophilin-like protein 10 isoform X3 n=1 Tax=Notolabrus celidotus TaxID=1203425 RepID=UPI0014906251|nr:butyrophilin-like protein 10 isoform X3 [Notolabrus celidotus]
MASTKLTVLATLSFILIVVGASLVTCQSQPVRAVEGDDVTLKVDFGTPINLTVGRVDVKRDDLNNVHSFRYRQDYLTQQSPQYKNRTTFITDHASKGEVGVVLSNVTQNDTGRYSFYVPAKKAHRFINLTVGEKSSPTEPPVINTTEPNNPGARALNAGKIAGIVLVVILLLVAAGVLIYCWISGRFKNCGGSGWTKTLRWNPLQQQEGKESYKMARERA